MNRCNCSYLGISTLTNEVQYYNYLSIFVVLIIFYVYNMLIVSLLKEITYSKVWSLSLLQKSGKNNTDINV